MTEPDNLKSMQEQSQCAGIPWRAEALRVGCLLAFVISAACVAREGLHDSDNSMIAMLLLTGVIATIASASRAWPLQNVAWAALVISVVAGGAHAIGALTGIVFGPFVFTDAAGPRLFRVLPAAIPAIWVVVILSSRGMAKWALHPFRNHRIYGFWLVCIASLLSVVSIAAIDPWASGPRRFWMWKSTLPVTWHGTPLTLFAGWFATSIVCMTFVTPMLIHKKPGAQPVDYGSPMVWLALDATFALLLLRMQFTLGAAVIVAAAFACAVPRLGTMLLGKTPPTQSNRRV
ncbi:MAG TPA: carotenoid biosynthesis protein [Verrucomicrobiae bacterium]|nr:carotenoid biosynthesis protein [Verrucomicrobiae bacterium]